MDRALDDVISDHQNGGPRGGRNRRRNNWPHDAARKTNGRDDDTNIDTDWLHDKYQDDDADTRRPARAPRNGRNISRHSPEADVVPQGGKLRVDNLHYDLTEDDLDDLFNRIGSVQSLSLRYDRAGRSTGTAFVTYTSLSSAHAAIREFDGANANGQPIRLALLPSIQPRRTEVRNPFDTAVKPGRSLFDRIGIPNDKARGRSRSPGAPRRTDTRGKVPEGVDRYVPGARSGSRSRSPIRRGGRGRRDDNGRNGRRDDSRRNGRRGDRDGGRQMVNGRPRVTQEELDKEMEDYWGKKLDSNSTKVSTENVDGPVSQTITSIDDGDIDMIE